jgi:hypothetical protein
MAKRRAKKASRKATMYCSFCGKPQYEVATLVAGPGVFICSECVDLCTKVIVGKVLDAKPFKRDVPTQSLLGQLRAIEDTLQGKGSQLQHTVEQLRSRKVSWAEIGAALGISRQSAWERFT